MPRYREDMSPESSSAEADCASALSAASEGVSGAFSEGALERRRYSNVSDRMIFWSFIHFMSHKRIHVAVEMSCN